MQLSELLAVIRQRWKLIVACILLAAAAAAAVTLTTTPVYEAHARIYLSAEKTSGESTGSVFAITSDDLDTYVSILDTPAVLNPLREELGLGARDEHARRGAQQQAAERGAAQDQLQGLAALTACDQGLETLVEVPGERIEQHERTVGPGGGLDEAAGLGARGLDAGRSEPGGRAREGRAQARAHLGAHSSPSAASRRRCCITPRPRGDAPAAQRAVVSVQ